MHNGQQGYRPERFGVWQIQHPENAIPSRIHPVTQERVALHSTFAATVIHYIASIVCRQRHNERVCILPQSTSHAAQSQSNVLHHLLCWPAAQKQQATPQNVETAEQCNSRGLRTTTGFIYRNCGKYSLPCHLMHSKCVLQGLVQGACWCANKHP